MTFATAGMTIGSTGRLLIHPKRGGSCVEAHASRVPSTIAMANEPSASAKVVTRTSPMPGAPNAVR
jgi:hypothetical protein